MGGWFSGPDGEGTGGGEGGGVGGGVGVGEGDGVQALPRSSATMTKGLAHLA